jgi:cell wall-associated NlpC family hydrolase
MKVHAWHKYKGRHRHKPSVRTVTIAVAVLTAAGLSPVLAMHNSAGSQVADVAVRATAAPPAVHVTSEQQVLAQDRARGAAAAAAQVQTMQSRVAHAAHVAHLARTSPAWTTTTTTTTTTATSVSTPAYVPPASSPPVPAPAPAMAPAPGGSLSARLLTVAEGEQGTPYAWGGAAPGGFDCSGLIYWAAGQLGITLPRDTFEMLAGSPHLVSVSSPVPGDLAFFGSGHVELYVSGSQTFGAQQAGTLVGFNSYGGGYVPTQYLRLVG